MEIWNSFTDKVIVSSQTRWFQAKTTFIQVICQLENVGPPFFKITCATLFQFCPFVSIRASLSYCCIYYLCCSTVLSGYCTVLFYFGILSAMKLHDFAWHIPFKSSGLSYGTRTPTYICNSYGSLLGVIVTGSNPNSDKIYLAESTHFYQPLKPTKDN